MAVNKVTLQGTDWQDWANQLLTAHYGPTEYLRVPDKDSGDAGIEGFTVTCGHAYQSYGCEEPIGLRERLKKQQDKMTRDVKNFIDNRAILERLFGNTKISRWVLFVPFYDSKDLIAHATKKTQEVIAVNLSYVAHDFKVTICQESDFISEKERLFNNKVGVIDYKISDTSLSELSEWTTNNDSLVTTIDGKTAKLPTLNTEEKRLRFRDSVLRWYLQGQELLDSLKNESPSTYGLVLKVKSQRERYLVADSIAASSPENQFNSAVEKLFESLKTETIQLSTFSCETLAHEGVADWIIRCPFDPV
ncbi:MAG TPA: hypothetical protein PKA76_18375 [Pirellulaceae bacterium]|nr:hypothetical protein [Pirellulaceae bacterium]